MARRVLIISASMGAGHDGAARELADRLKSGGDDARVIDFMQCAPLGIGTLVRVLYELQLRLVPWAYEATYRVWYLLPLLISPAVGFVSFLTSRRVRRHIREFQAETVVTTYPLASLTLGRMRAKGRVRVPVCTFVTDFAVHPLWVHPGVDLNLCVHPQSAARAAEMTSRPSLAPGPLVPARFDRRHRPAVAEARRLLGLPADATIVLVVAGSWGVGDVEATFADLLATGRYFPVAVCGRNAKLKARLERHGGGRVLGWTDQMPALLAAADAIVQNAGGLTCMEAFAAGLPVVSFRPIPGHGRENALEMEKAGVAAFARSATDLVVTLDRVTTLAGHRMVGLAQEMFTGDAAEDVRVLVAAATEDELAERRSRRVGLRVGLAGVALVVGYTGINVAANAATALGYSGGRVDRSASQVYIAVRLGPDALLDPKTPTELRAAHVTAIVGGTLAEQYRAQVQNLSLAGVDVANGGWGHRSALHVFAANDDVDRATKMLRQATGTPPRVFAPDQPVNSFDVATARLDHQVIVRPLRSLDPADIPLRFRAGGVYVIDARDVDGATALQAALVSLDLELTDAHLTAAPLAELIHPAEVAG